MPEKKLLKLQEYRGEKQGGDVDLQLDEQYTERVLQRAQEHTPHLLAMNERLITDMHWDMNKDAPEFQPPPPTRDELEPPLRVRVVPETPELRSSFMF